MLLDQSMLRAVFGNAFLELFQIVRGKDRLFQVFPSINFGKLCQSSLSVVVVLDEQMQSLVLEIDAVWCDLDLRRQFFGAFHEIINELFVGGRSVGVVLGWHFEH